MSLSDLAFAGLEEAVNRCIALDSEAGEKLAKLHGRVIALEFSGPNLRLYFIPGPGRLQVLKTIEGEPDCLIKGSPFTLARMDTKGGKGADQLFSGKVEIEGDTELGHQFGAILGNLDLDWEEQLSHIMGDVLAHEIGNGVRGLTGWGKRTLDTIGRDITEYVTEQTRLLPEHPEIQAFVDGIDRLRDDVDRLEARMNRLRQEAEAAKGDPQS